jgi:hypothetical protein
LDAGVGVRTLLKLPSRYLEKGKGLTVRLQFELMRVTGFPRPVGL